MSLTWDQLCIVGIGALALVGFVFGFALIAYDTFTDPGAGSQFDDLDPCGDDFADWAELIQLHHRTTSTTPQNGPDRAA